MRFLSLAFVRSEKPKMFKGLQIKVSVRNYAAVELFRQNKALADKRSFQTEIGAFLTRSSLSSLQYVRGSDPVLKLLDDEGNISEELSILKWNTDSVEEFLSEKLDRI